MARPPKKPQDRRTDSMKIPMTAREKITVEDAAIGVGARPVTWARETLLRVAIRVRKRKGV